jgi:hypothetical protein
MWLSQEAHVTTFPTNSKMSLIKYNKLAWPFNPPPYGIIGSCDSILSILHLATSDAFLLLIFKILRNSILSILHLATSDAFLLLIFKVLHC